MPWHCGNCYRQGRQCSGTSRYGNIDAQRFPMAQTQVSKSRAPLSSCSLQAKRVSTWARAAASPYMLHRQSCLKPGLVRRRGCRFIETIKQRMSPGSRWQACINVTVTAACEVVVHRDGHGTGARVFIINQYIAASAANQASPGTRVLRVLRHSTDAGSWTRHAGVRTTLSLIFVQRRIDDTCSWAVGGAMGIIATYAGSGAGKG